VKHLHIRAPAFHRDGVAGTKPNLARLTIARRIAALVLAMWKHEEVYDAAKHRSQFIAQA
jgi:hypothetical protein